MKPSAKTQHRHNATKEMRWIADAKRDRRDLLKAGHILRTQGRNIEASFDFQEAQNAVSWIGKRKRILSKERRLSF